jgi:spore germination protein
MLIHVVQAGETIYSIATQYGVNPARLMSDNGVGEDGALAVGQALVVLFPRVIHAVTEGDTLSSIARAYGISLRQLYRNNYFLGGRDAVYPGNALVISYVSRPIGSMVTNGYAYPHIRRPTLQASLPYMTCLTPFTYGITAAGGLLPLQDGLLLSDAAAIGTTPLMHLSSITETGDFSNARSTLILTNPALQEPLIEEIIATVTEKGYRGVDVDFEFVPPEEREAYAAFVARLRERLAPLRLPVIVALAPKTYAGQKGLLYEAHDYALLGAAADFVFLMTYEWGYTYGPPMAVSPLPQVRSVLDYAVTEIAPEKIFLGMPNYGYDWPLPFQQGVTAARSISNGTAVRLAIDYGVEIQYDERAQAPCFRYTDRVGTAHEVWFEDARSTEAKLRLVAEYGFRGAGYWNLMRPFAQGWNVLNSLYNI